jgi:GNAT superfamily N-acetyltransferase
MAFTLRAATPADCGDIARLVRALAEYEKLASDARATEADFHAALFGATPRAEAAVAIVDRVTVGFALWFYNFSTFMGRAGLYVEDVFVEPAHRGAGIGRAFFRMMAARAVSQGCGRMEWSVLDWNTPAVNFYRALGAEPMTEWTVQRLTGATLRTLAEEHDHG